MNRLTEIIPKLGKLLPMLSSNRDGEVLATVSAIGRALKSVGCDWHDRTKAITAPPAATSDGWSHRGHDRDHGDDKGGWRAMHAYCWSRVDQLSAREVDFMTTLNRWKGNPTKKQFSWLRSIYDRLQQD
jgi:hypothetical protein